MREPKFADKQSATDDVVCWSRMQAEAGQSLRLIIRRKELERQACRSIFFWGVGNAPSRFTRQLAGDRAQIPVIFSVMRSEPKRQDRCPAGLLVWRGYEDHNGRGRRLPDGALVTSRFREGNVHRHYALMCESADPLSLTEGDIFDPAAYRNLGADGAQIGSSQVTTLARKIANESAGGGYRRNMMARLTGSFWVRLLDPILITGQEMQDVMKRLSDTALDLAGWTALVMQIKSGRNASVDLYSCPELPFHTTQTRHAGSPRT